ncbi:MAG: glutamine synthetase family protein [Pseudomonadota bacterium]
MKTISKHATAWNPAARGLDMLRELDTFLAARPALRFIDLLLPDLHGVDRGKRVDIASSRSIFANGLLLPGSMFALTVAGSTVQATGLGFDEGDADRPCLPVAGTLVDVPWLAHGVAQVQIAMHERDGQPFAGDPRHLLQRLLTRFAALGLTPVVAIELEFYLIDKERTPMGLPQPPLSPLTGRREYRTQMNSMIDLDEYSGVLAAIDHACHTQAVPSTTALAEYGPGQFEVNLQHSDNALSACDQAVRFKRIVKCVARHHGMDATFLPKPYADMAGSGLHVHVSLNDAQGRNVFASDLPLGSEPMQHAAAGMLATMADGMAIFAPLANSWRRFRPETYVPLTADWSVNNRGAALRVPASDADNRRLEHRVAGAEANPYLVVTWILGGLLHGLTQRRLPQTPLEGNAYTAAQQRGEALPRYWPTALDRFDQSSFARELLGPQLHRLYAMVKRHELDEFNSHVTAQECAAYLPAL